jgi:hypothetical protein
MQKYGRICWAGLVSFLFGATPPATAEPVVVHARLVRENGKPMAGTSVRMAAGGEGNARGPSAGQWLKTDSNGRIEYTTEAPVKSRSVTLDTILARHPSRRIELGIEMDLVGRRALYWVELDLVRSGALARMTAYVAGKDGRFDQPLTFHPPRIRGRFQTSRTACT